MKMADFFFLGYVCEHRLPTWGGNVSTNCAFVVFEPFFAPWSITKRTMGILLSILFLRFNLKRGTQFIPIYIGALVLSCLHRDYVGTLFRTPICWPLRLAVPLETRPMSRRPDLGAQCFSRMSSSSTRWRTSTGTQFCPPGTCLSPMLCTSRWSMPVWSVVYLTWIAIVAVSLGAHKKTVGCLKVLASRLQPRWKYKLKHPNPAFSSVCGLHKLYYLSIREKCEV